MKTHCVTLVLLVLVASVNASAQKPGSAQAPERVESLVEGYSIVLVQGDMQSGSAADGVPKAAQQALSDMKDFLPYKSYSLVDSGWVRGETSRLHIRLRGLSGQDIIEASINVGWAPERQLGVGFGLEAGGVLLISNRFTMRVGETVVVGTSRLGGDKALIALLTAVPRNSRKE
jgi:hypothetical protein